jgi:hypothetical protein
MNKQEIREASKIINYGQHLGADYMARGLSALYRSARTKKSQNAILALGIAYKVVSNPEWII